MDFLGEPIELTPNMCSSNHLSTGKLYKMEFFTNEESLFYYTDINDKKLGKVLNWMMETVEYDTVGLDLEWKAVFVRGAPERKVSLFQIGTNKRAVIIRYVEQKNKGKNHELLAKFLQTHTFIGKGVGNDRKKLRERFNFNTPPVIKDMEVLYLKKDKSFQGMVDKFAGKPTASFKNKKVSTSNWEAENLTYKQIIYSVFDVVALYKSFITANKTIPEEERQKAKEEKKERKRKRREENIKKMENQRKKSIYRLSAFKVISSFVIWKYI